MQVFPFVPFRVVRNRCPCFQRKKILLYKFHGFGAPPHDTEAPAEKAKELERFFSELRLISDSALLLKLLTSIPYVAGFLRASGFFRVM